LIPLSRPVRWAAAALLLLSAAGCGLTGYLRDPFVDIPEFSQVTEDLYRGGVPKEAGYARLKALGVRTIIDFRGVPEQGRPLPEAAQGFRRVSIPLSVYAWPEDEKALKFLQTVLDPEAHPVFVHCSSGRDRTGAMVAVYRVIVQEWGPKEAYREALAHGFWPYRGEVVLKKYIHQLRDRKVLYDFVRSRSK